MVGGETKRDRDHDTISIQLRGVYNSDSESVGKWERRWQ